MNAHNLQNLTQVLQASISPVALVSGVGLLLLSQTNRLGRVMDRLRSLLEQRRRLEKPDAPLERAILVLYRRTRILRCAVTSAALSILLASVLVLLLFATAVSGAQMDIFAIVIFSLSVLSLVISLVLFILDMNLSLKAMQEEFLRQ